MPAFIESRPSVADRNIPRFGFLKLGASAAAAVALPRSETLDRLTGYREFGRGEFILPNHITIPSLNIDYRFIPRAKLETKVWMDTDTRQFKEVRTWEAPISGVGTPVDHPAAEPGFGDYRNKIFLFGHTRSDNDVTSLLGNLNQGDKIIINDGIDKITGESVSNLHFKIPDDYGIFIADQYHLPGLLSSSYEWFKPRGLHVALQASYKQSDEGAAFLLNQTIVQNKARFRINQNRNLDDPRSYLSLVIFGHAA